MKSLRAFSSRAFALPCVVSLALSMPGGASARSFDTIKVPIVGGQPATEAQFHSTVAIVDPQTGAPFCTGTLVSPRVIVTAAHCLVEQNEDTDEITAVYTPEQAEVVVNVLDPTDAGPDDRYEVEALVVHPTYPMPGSDKSDPVGMGEQNDIAVLMLTEAVEGMDPTPILPMSRVGDALSDGTAIIITGFGINDLQSEAGGVLHIAETDFQRHNGKEYFAAGATDSCSGDSGGPGYLMLDGQRYLIGASARGNETAQVKCGEGGINTLVPAYADWVAEKAGALWAPPTVDGNTGDPNGAPADSAEGDDGCSASHSPTTAWPLPLLLLGLLLLLRRTPART